MVTYALDASALLRFLDDEHGALKVSKILNRHVEAKCAVTWHGNGGPLLGAVGFVPPPLEVVGALTPTGSVGKFEHPREYTAGSGGGGAVVAVHDILIERALRLILDSLQHGK